MVFVLTEKLLLALKRNAISSLMPHPYDGPFLAALLRVQRACPQRCQLSGALRGSQGAQSEEEHFSAIINCISWLFKIVFLGY